MASTPPSWVLDAVAGEFVAASDGYGGTLITFGPSTDLDRGAGSWSRQRNRSGG
jgi:hypothetical protein